jgi:PPOX class probable F420-dependent enzyme
LIAPPWVRIGERPSYVPLPLGREEHHMHHDKLHQFADQKYLNLETYRKNGTPVATPMWFAEHHRVLYVYSRANAGKVKRIRQNPTVRVVPCTARGTPTGDWVGGTARMLDKPDAALGHQRLNAKYGWLKRFGDVVSRLRNRARVVMAIELG